MKERPILMHARSMNGILEGRKTQTRRIIKLRTTGPNPPNDYYDFYKGDKWVGAVGAEWKGAPVKFSLKCPYGVRGDQLWVRETFGIFSADSGTVSVGFKQRLPKGKTISDTDGGLNVLQVDPEIVRWAESRISDGKWRPSIFMPRWASRLTLEITGIRVERVQDICMSDCMAEGIVQIPHGILRVQVFGLPDWPKERYKISACEVFGELWEETNGKGAWERNDWCFVVDFKRIDQ